MKLIHRINHRHHPPTLPSPSELSGYTSPDNSRENQSTSPPSSSVNSSGMNSKLPSGVPTPQIRYPRGNNPPPVPDRPDPVISVPPIPTTPTFPEILSMPPYYHGHIENPDQLLPVITPHLSKPGSFAVRKSQSSPGALSISVAHHTGLKHFTVKTNAQKLFFIKEGQLFNRINDLVKYYFSNPVPNNDGVDGLYLKHPIYCTENCPGLKPSFSQPGMPRQQCRPNPGEEGKYIGTGIPKVTPMSTTPNPFESEVKPVKDYYTIIAQDEGKLDQLIEHLQISDIVEEEQNQCECGLTLEQSQLPRRWTYHISKEPETFGRIFYLSPEGEKSWSLPFEICLELEPQQQDRLRDLLRASDGFITCRNAIAKQYPKPEMRPPTIQLIRGSNTATIDADPRKTVRQSSPEAPKVEEGDTYGVVDNLHSDYVRPDFANFDSGYIKYPTPKDRIRKAKEGPTVPKRDFLSPNRPPNLVNEPAVMTASPSLKRSNTETGLHLSNHVTPSNATPTPPPRRNTVPKNSTAEQRTERSNDNYLPMNRVMEKTQL